MATMQLTEQINQKEAHYVINLSFDEFFKIFPKSNTDDIDKARDYHRMVKKYILSHISNQFAGETISYLPARGITTGRLYGQHSSGMCLQRMHKTLRFFLTKDLYHDYDIKNAHPTILLSLCKKHTIPCPLHEYYVNNRPSILKDNHVTKHEMLVKLNLDKPFHSPSKSKYISDLCKEWIQIKVKLYNIYYDDYHNESDEGKNPISTIINRVFCDVERKLLTQVTKDIQYHVNMFDGFLSIEKHKIDDLTYDGVTFSFEEKEIETDVVVPSDYEIPDNDGDTYKIMKREFEKNYCKIIELAGFCRIDENGNISQYSRENIKVMHEDKHFLKTGTGEKRSFINNWFVDDMKRSYRKLGCYPDPKKCPADELNTWTPFAVEKMALNHYDEEVVKKFTNHIHILCNNEKHVSDFMLKVVAQYFQHPDCKSIFPTFVGEEGCGKSLLFEGICKMMGADKIYYTTDPKKAFLGEFNGDLAGKKLVILNELNPAELGREEKKFKSLLTDFPLRINPKGEKPYHTQSYHVFVGMMNPKDEGDGVKSKHGDRRNLVIRCSDEKCGDDGYFNELWKIFEDENSMATLYKYFVDIPDVPRIFTTHMIPETIYQNNIKEANKSYLNLWLESICDININKSTITMTSKECLTSHNDWIKDNNIQEYQLNSIKLGLKLKNLKEATGKRTNKGALWNFDLDALRKKYGIGCLIKIEDKQEAYKKIEDKQEAYKKIEDKQEAYDSDASCESDLSGT